MKPAEFLCAREHATALTRGGDLHSATTAIQHALGGTPMSVEPRSDVIDVDARWIPDLDDPRLPAAPELSGSHSEQFIAGRFGVGNDARDYTLYVPPRCKRAGDRPASAGRHAAWLHARPDDFAAGTRMNEAAREHGLFVMYLVQSRKANPQGCWNWFKHNHQTRGRGEPALLTAMVRHIASQYAVDPARVYVAGLSAGGAMAAILGQTYPEIFAAIGVHSGLPAGMVHDVPSALHAMKAAGRRTKARWVVRSDDRRARRRAEAE